jgi:hypothetical protein
MRTVEEDAPEDMNVGKSSVDGSADPLQGIP